jgi:hypothetical protein
MRGRCRRSLVYPEHTVQHLQLRKRGAEKAQICYDPCAIARGQPLLRDLTHLRRVEAVQINRVLTFASHWRRNASRYPSLANCRVTVQ